MNSNHLIRIRQRRRDKIRKGTPRRLAQLFTTFGIVGAVIFIAVPAGLAGMASAAYSYLTKDLPDVNSIKKIERDFQTTKIYDRNSKLLYEIIDPTGGDRQWVQLGDISPFLRCATVAIEDKTFWDNEGFDVRGIARAAVANLRGEQRQGGSGITQQLVKKVVLPPEEQSGPGRTNLVKIKEVLLSQEISRKFKKPEILEWYMNTNFYGNLAYGIEAASKVYFGKKAKDLNLAEAAMLAAIPQFPKQNPFDSPVQAKDRQSLVLDLMVERTKFGVKDCGVTLEDARAAKSQTLKYSGRTDRFSIKSPHFAVYAKERAVELLADYLGIGVESATELVERGGLKIYTTLDLDLDEQVRRIANEKISKLQAENRDVNNAAAVVIKPSTGEILSMVGSLDYFNDAIDGRYNVATALRQPGSSFKPITYLELLRQGNPPSTLFWDVPTEFPGGETGPYKPKNYDDKFHGPATMRISLARSYNIPAVKALQAAGIGNVIRTAQKLGITDLNRGLDFYGLALTLGGGEVKLLDMTYVYSVFANYGTMNGVPRPQLQRRPGFRELDPVAILRVDREERDPATGKLATRTLYDFKGPATNPNLLGPNSKQYAYQLISILSDPQARADAFGFPSVLDLPDGRRSAVKTGTTNDYRDNWTLGFTQDYVVGVWVGNTDNHPMSEGLSGVAGAAPIWNDVMTLLHAGKPNSEFPIPDGLERGTVCSVDGLVPNDACPSAQDWFLPGEQPTEQSTLVSKVVINKETKKLASATTPEDKREERLVYAWPGTAEEWYNALDDKGKEKWLMLPKETDDGLPAAVSGDVALAFPYNGGYVSPNINGGVVQIRGNAKGGAWQLYKVFVAPGHSPTPEQWVQIGPDHPEQIDNNVLENWNLAGFGPGPYSVRIVRFGTDGSQTEAVAKVILDATPPTGQLVSPQPGALYSASRDKTIQLSAQAQDDITISRVDFYANDALIATKYSAPFEATVSIGPTRGNVNFSIAVTDGAGNTVRSAQVTVALGD